LNQAESISRMAVPTKGGGLAHLGTADRSADQVARGRRVLWRGPVVRPEHVQPGFPAGGLRTGTTLVELRPTAAVILAREEGHHLAVGRARTRYRRVRAFVWRHSALR
jgi:hypothetical protein